MLLLGLELFLIDWRKVWGVWSSLQLLPWNAHAICYFSRVSFRILEDLGTVFGRLPCFCICTLSVYNHSKDAQVQRLTVTEFVQNDVMPLAQWLTPCFCAQVTLHMYIHLTQETCCICIGWLNRWSIQDLLYFYMYNFYLLQFLLKAPFPEVAYLATGPSLFLR